MVEGMLSDYVNWEGDGRPKQLLTMKTEGSGRLEKRINQGVEWMI